MPDCRAIRTRLSLTRARIHARHPRSRAISVPLTGVGSGISRLLTDNCLARSAWLARADTSLCKQGVSGSSPLSSTRETSDSDHGRDPCVPLASAAAVIPMGEVWEALGLRITGVLQTCPPDVPEPPSTASDRHQQQPVNLKLARGLNPMSNARDTLVMRSSRLSTRDGAGLTRDDLAWRASAECRQTRQVATVADRGPRISRKPLAIMDRSRLTGIS
jgi:hypothetical protein